MAKVVGGKTLLTYSDYVHFPEDGRRHELIDGECYVTPSPVTLHQRISKRLQHQLYEQIDLAGRGEVFTAPYDVLLSDIDVVQPDLVVVLAGNEQIITSRNLRGVPDLVVEITSPSTKKRDSELKLALYEKHGVPEYWIVHTDEKAVEKLALRARLYQSLGRFTDRIEADGLEGVTVDLGEVW